MPKLTRTKRSKRRLPKTKRRLPKIKRSRTRRKIRQQRGGWPWSKKSDPAVVEVAEVAAATEADEAVVAEKKAAEKEAAEREASEKKRLEEQAKSDAMWKASEEKRLEEQAKSYERWEDYYNRRDAARLRREAAEEANLQIAQRYNDYEKVEKHYGRKPISRREWEMRNFAAKVAPSLASSWIKEPTQNEINKVNEEQQAEKARLTKAYQMKMFNMTSEQYDAFEKKNDEAAAAARLKDNYGVWHGRDTPI